MSQQNLENLAHAFTFSRPDHYNWVGFQFCQSGPVYELNWHL